MKQEMTPDKAFWDKFQSWRDGFQKIVEEHYKNNFPSLIPDTIFYSIGDRFIKVQKITHHRDAQGNVVEGQIFAAAFIAMGDFETKAMGVVKIGDVFKSASWLKPAKHARGNIFDDNNGLKCITPTGHIEYLK